MSTTVTTTPPTLTVPLYLSFNPAAPAGTNSISIAMTNDDQDEPVITGIDPTIATLSPLTHTQNAGRDTWDGTFTAVALGSSMGTVTIDGVPTNLLAITVANTAPEVGNVTIGTPTVPAVPPPAS